MARPCEYDPDTHIPAVFSAECMAGGATWSAIAKACAHSIPTVRQWAKDHPAFLAAVKQAKAMIDDEVEAAFEAHAAGRAVKSVTRKPNGDVVTEHYPPDTTAGIFWLCNRRPKGYDPDDPEAGWRHVQRVEVTGAGGGPVEHKDVSIADYAEQALEVVRAAESIAEAAASGISSGDA